MLVPPVMCKPCGVVQPVRGVVQPVSGVMQATSGDMQAASRGSGQG